MATHVYQKVADQMRADIASGRLRAAEGDRLPPERALQHTYAVSRPTINKAIKILEEEGLVEVSHRLGTRLTIRPPVATAPDDLLPRRIGFVAPFAGSVLSQRLLRGIQRVASRRGYSVLLACSGPPWMSQERLAALELISAQARGLVITPAPRRRGELNRDYLRHEELGVPIVLTDMAVPEQGHTQVLLDNEAAAYNVTSWLLGLGRRRIGVIGEPEGWTHPSLAARRRGHLAALADHGLPVDASLIRSYCSDDEVSLVESHIRDWLRSPDPPTAIIAQEDLGAMEAIDHLAAGGIRCPQDVIVVGFDNRDEAQRYRTPFPTTDPNFERLGEIACAALIDEIETGAPPNRTFILEVPLLLRGVSDLRSLTLRRSASDTTASGDDSSQPAGDAAGEHVTPGALSGSAVSGSA